MQQNFENPLSRLSNEEEFDLFNDVTTKTDAGTIDGTPDKRLFWSIISDYDLKTAICELVDNSIDIWMAKKLRGALEVRITIETDRQLIRISDNAGGVAEEDLPNLIAPGASRNVPEAATIGIFGVGSKRAVIALAENVTIKTRHAEGPAFQIDISNDWIASSEWVIPHYRIPVIAPNTTSIDLSALRIGITDADVASLQEHLGEVYAWFLAIDDCNIFVNNRPTQEREFDSWAYPDEFPPREILLTHEFEDFPISIELTGGLIRDRDPKRENYGVYFYCNNRLIIKELRVREVGYFVSSEAGVPHPDASLCRVIVRINGGAKWMPWNSSKSAIRFDHPVFAALRPTLLPLVAHYSSLSRRLKDNWEEKVFAFPEGCVAKADPEEPDKGHRLILPPLPKVRKPAVAKLKSANAAILEDSPWTLGLLEAVSAVDSIQKLKLETRNRIALILLDSNFEIALKEFVVHRPDLFPPQNYGDAKIKEMFSARHKVVAEVKKIMGLSDKLVQKANHYYGLRNKLIHERATVGITDADVANYRDTIEKILEKLFDLDFHP
jgi:hypothetical protein